jgi:hypothetical protein
VPQPLRQRIQAQREEDKKEDKKQGQDKREADKDASYVRRLRVPHKRETAKTGIRDSQNHAGLHIPCSSACNGADSVPDPRCHPILLAATFRQAN